MRVIFHGPFKMAAEHAQLLLLSTRDPYNLTEYLDCQSTHFSLQYNTGGAGKVVCSWERSAVEGSCVTVVLAAV